jgi:tetratricopeptide (TPR) repeat protein
MKPTHFTLFFLTLLLISCSDKSNSSEFMEQVTGKYLYNLDETVEVYFEENKLLMKWRGKDKIAPMDLGDETFFIKEMNEKIQFLINPTDRIQYISLIPKEKTDAITYNFRKLEVGEYVPSSYLKNKEYDKALEGYLTIKESDSTNTYISETNFNSLGYRELRAENYADAIEIFKINTALYPNSDNVYDSLAEAYFRKGDTISAVENYKNAIAIDSGNRRAKDFVKKYEKK